MSLMATTAASGQVPSRRSTDTWEAGVGDTTSIEGWVTLISLQMIDPDGREGQFTIERSSLDQVQARGLITNPDGFKAGVLVSIDANDPDPNSPLDWQVVNVVDLGNALQLDVVSASLPDTTIVMTVVGGGGNRLAYGTLGLFLQQFNANLVDDMLRKIKQLRQAWKQAVQDCLDVAIAVCGKQSNIKSMAVKLNQFGADCQFTCR